MRRMHEADSALRERIQAGFAGSDNTVTMFELDEHNQIVACSPTKILASNITTLRPRGRVLPSGFEVDVKTRLRPLTESIDTRLRELVGTLPAAGEHPDPTEISLADACELLQRIEPAFVGFAPGYEDTWNLLEHQAILRHLSDATANPANRGQVLLMLRTGRNVSRKPGPGSNAEFNEPDSTRNDITPARAAATALPVLMLIRQEGLADGWTGAPFWWPVIYLPESMRPTLFAKSK
jgi:hypothetical protein